MRISMHAGNCCGIKHISGFDLKPYTKDDLKDNGVETSYEDYIKPVYSDCYRPGVEPPILRKKELYPDGDCPRTGQEVDLEADANGAQFWSGWDFFRHYGSDPIPAELNTERFDRYLKFLSSKREQGLVEVALVTGTEDCFNFYKHQALWVPVIEERGFKKVSEFINSNSDNRVGVWHLLMGQ